MTHSKAQLQALLAQYELEALIEQLRLICLQAPNDQHGNELILLIARYHEFLDKKDQLYAADRDVASNQIKEALQNFIELLDLPEGEPEKVKWIRGKSFWGSWVKSPWRWSLLVLLLSMLAIGLGQIRVRKTEFVLEAKVSAMTLRPTETWRIGEGYDLLLKKLELENATQYNGLPTEAPAAFASLEGERIQLNELPIEAGQSCFLKQDKKELILSLGSGHTELVAEVMATRLQIPDWGIDTLLGLKHANIGEERVRLTSSTHPRFWLVACDSLPEVWISSLDFGHKEKDQPEPVSSLQSGHITVEAQRYDLSAADRLHFTRLENARLGIKPMEGSFHVHLKGTARGLITGNQAKRTNLMPTWLRYLRYNQSFLFYFSALSALFALLLPLRSWLVK